MTHPLERISYNNSRLFPHNNSRFYLSSALEGTRNENDSFGNISTRSFHRRLPRVAFAPSPFSIKGALLCRSLTFDRRGVWRVINDMRLVRYVRLGFSPFSTAVPLWGQTTWN